jgi:hypothetical protein
MPFTTLRRTPLAELPLRNYIERPPSPLKSYSSPGKIQPAILGSPKPKSHSPSPSRPTSIHTDHSARHQLFREAINRVGSPASENKSSPIEDEIASPKPTKPTSIRQLSSPSSSLLLQRSPLLISPSKKATTSAAPQSLGKKKERIRRQLLDEDEEGDEASVNIRAGSPSPAKMKAEREDALRGSSISSVKGEKTKEAIWTVWQDEEVDQSSTFLGTDASSAVNGEDEDKENMRPSGDFNNTTGRKKGTGGRLSLLATGDESMDDVTIADSQEKRRKVTPLAPSV